MKAVTSRWTIRACPPPASGRFQGLAEIALRSDGLLAERIGARRLLGFRLERAWATAVGERVRAVTRLHECRDRTLVVDVSDAAWKRELEKLQPVILARLAESLPERPLATISFRLRHSTARNAPPRTPASPASQATVAAGAPGAADHGAPPGTLDDRMHRVLSRYLSRRAAVE